MNANPVKIGNLFLLCGAQAEIAETLYDMRVRYV